VAQRSRIDAPGTITTSPGPVRPGLIGSRICCPMRGVPATTGLCLHAMSAAQPFEESDSRPLVSVLGLGQMGCLCRTAGFAGERRETGTGAKRPGAPLRVNLWGHSADEEDSSRRPAESPA